MKIKSIIKKATCWLKTFFAALIAMIFIVAAILGAWTVAGYLLDRL